MDESEGDAARDGSPERRRSRVSGQKKTTNRLKEIAAEAKERGFKPLPSNKLYEALPPTRETTVLLDKLPEGKNCRNMTSVNIIDQFFSHHLNIWRSVAEFTNEKIAKKIELKENPTFGPHVSPAEVRLVYFLRLQLTMLKGTSLKETYRELGLGQYMSLDRFNFISANAVLDAEKLCEVIRHRSLDPLRYNTQLMT